MKSKKTIILNISPEDWAKLKAMAALSRHTLKDYLSVLIEQHVLELEVEDMPDNK